MLGNATYGAGVRRFSPPLPPLSSLLPHPAIGPKLTRSQILFHSTERRYFLTNLPWLIGSLGTMAEDAIIFVQFHAFGEPPPPPPAAAAE